MPRIPQPWYRKDRDAWFVTIGGTRHNLGPDKKTAFDRFYELMRQPKAAKVASDSFAAVADAFLDWVSRNQAEATYEWYRFRLEKFCKLHPNLTIGGIRPYHVQQWVDASGELSQNSR